MFIIVANMIMNPAHIVHAMLDPDGEQKVTVLFDTGKPIVFLGAEAAALWKELDKEKDWRDEWARLSELSRPASAVNPRHF